MRQAILKARMSAHKSALLWSMALILAGAVILPSASYVFTALVPTARAQWEKGHNPRADYWRQARQGQVGTTNVRDPGADVLIQSGGQNWRQLRNGVVASITPWFMAAMVILIGLFHLLGGRSRLREPRSGQTIQRWSLYSRTLHWYTAILFMLMVLSGLSLLFGRAALIPILGHAGFAPYAWVMKYVHNFLGPLFMAGVLLIIVSWIRWNIPKARDFKWLTALFKKGEHVPAGRMNGGEMLWFWFIALFGLAVCVTGLIMDFPLFGQSRAVMQVSNLIHGFVAVAWIALFFGHAYIGTAGTEGALEGITRGDVSVEWARQHHELWYQEASKEGPASAAKLGGKAAPGSPGSASS